MGQNPKYVALRKVEGTAMKYLKGIPALNTSSNAVNVNYTDNFQKFNLKSCSIKT